MADPAPAPTAPLNNIQHFVVLMLENRSFDHILGALKAQNAAVDGALDIEFSNHTDPASPSSPIVGTGSATAFAMPFDPGHEFEDVQIQLYGRVPSAAYRSGADEWLRLQRRECSAKSLGRGDGDAILPVSEATRTDHARQRIRRVQLLALVIAGAHLAQPFFCACSDLRRIERQSQRPGYHGGIHISRRHTLSGA
jgi:Phosphoesterase family